MTLMQQSIDLARLLRLGYQLEVSQQLPTLFEAIISTHSNQLQRLAPIMAQILACQERADHLGLADWLEYELVALLAALQSSSPLKADD